MSGVSRRAILKMGSGNIGRADDAQAAPVEDMGVPLGRSDVAMPEQFLNRADIIAAFQKVSGEAVAKDVGGSMFRDSGLLHSLFYCFLNDGFMDVVATL